MRQGKPTNVEEPIDGKSTNEGQSPSTPEKGANGVEDKEQRIEGLLE